MYGARDAPPWMNMTMFHRLLGLIAIAAEAALMSSLAFAQAAKPPDTGSPEVTLSCPGLVAANRPRIVPASFDVAALDADQVRITYVGHATFLIESPQLVRIATDYNDYVRPPVVPDIATMNHAHETHYTDNPDPAIKYVLRGWGPSETEPASWDVKYKDVRVRNVPTNIRNWAGGTERYGNSIFIFEMANLCIAHLGHLHHTLTQQQLDEIGRPDVVMAPVDGNLTLDLDGMMEVLTALKPQIIIPMHFFNQFTLGRFLDRARQLWPVEQADIPSFVVSKATLPASPKVLVLPGH
jgi:L-ascorbate metabolism protein UlaG (beta-lactamase superfamily)